MWNCLYSVNCVILQSVVLLFQYDRPTGGSTGVVAKEARTVMARETAPGNAFETMYVANPKASLLGKLGSETVREGTSRFRHFYFHRPVHIRT